MIFDIISILLCIVIIFTTFKAEAICKKLFKTDEPAQQQIMRVKYAALIVAIVLFLITILR